MVKNKLTGKLKLPQMHQKSMEISLTIVLVNYLNSTFLNTCFPTNNFMPSKYQQTSTFCLFLHITYRAKETKQYHKKSLQSKALKSKPSKIQAHKYRVIRDPCKSDTKHLVLLPSFPGGLEQTQFRLSEASSGLHK